MAAAHDLDNVSFHEPLAKRELYTAMSTADAFVRGYPGVTTLQVRD